MPPTIQVFPMQANVGETPDFMKNVVASDSCSSVTIKVDSTTYNINAAGDYMVTYTATDSAGNVATAQAPLKVIDENTKIIYLTFDDGPSNNTGRILKILEQEGVKATFFVTAQFKDHLHFIKDEFEAGHAIAAHTYSHAFSIYRSIDTYFEDLERIEQLIEAQTGQRTKIIRFPGGSNNTVNRRYAKRNIMPELIKDEFEAGHAIAAHTYSHAFRPACLSPTRATLTATNCACSCTTPMPRTPPSRHCPPSSATSRIKATLSALSPARATCATSALNTTISTDV